MTGERSRGREIRSFVLENVLWRSGDIAKATVERFGISRQAVHKHVAALVAAGLLEARGATRRREYRLKAQLKKTYRFDLSEKPEEDRIWREQLLPLVAGVSRNARDILEYGVTEMINNAIDHSGGRNLRVALEQTAATTEIHLIDDGEGIFLKIQRTLGLAHPRESVLELAKGKLTTDPARHSGEGVFFTSRAVDRFQVRSGGLHFSYRAGDEDYRLIENPGGDTGTGVSLLVAHNTRRTLKNVFDRHSSDDGDYAFVKTRVPVRLAQADGETLASRSQAKRIATRFEKFREVILDFKGVETIGQGFADELFRVFTATHPQVQLIPVNAGRQVKSMIARAAAGRKRA